MRSRERTVVVALVLACGCGGGAPDVERPSTVRAGIQDPARSSTDLLFVMSRSGASLPARLEVWPRLGTLFDALRAGGKPLRVAVVPADASASASGGFWTTPSDVLDEHGQLVRRIPQDFCDKVASVSAGGVLDPDDPALVDVLDSWGTIPDFTGRAKGQFQDQDGDGVADNVVAASFADAAGCILAVETAAAGEQGLCAMAAALDAASLAGENSGLLTDPDSLLAIVYLSAADDRTAAVVEHAGEVSCLAASELCADTDAAPTSLVPISAFFDHVASLRGADSVFMGAITRSPWAPLDDCAATLPVPSCFNATSGQASPGNRYFDFANLFPNKLDALSGADICSDFDVVFGNIGEELETLLEDDAAIELVAE